MNMQIICAWCNKNLGIKESEHVPGAAPITHGICPDCLRKVLAYKSEPLRKFLDRFKGPVLLVDSDGRVVTANKTAFSILKKKTEDVDGKLGGDAFGCKYADLPGGCGQTEHCKTCTIRNTVTDTARTGKSHVRVPAYPDLHMITGENKLKFLISTEKIDKFVLLRIDEITEEPK